MDFIDGHIALDRDSVQERLCHTDDTLGELEQIGLVEFCGGSVIKKRHGGRKLVLDLLADGFVSALSKVCDCLKVSGVIPVVINVKMIGFVNVPVELCIKNFVFSVIRKIDYLGKAHVQADQNKKKKEKAFFENSHVFSLLFT
jgi:hypothetical protein